MILTTPYKCKICGRDAIARYDSDCPIVSLDAWRSMLTCNRCYDYRDSLNRIRSAIVSVCRDLEVARFHNKQFNYDENRDRLCNYTKKLTTLVCSFCGVTNQWDSAVVDLLMHSPEASGKIVSDYISTLRPA